MENTVKLVKKGLQNGGRVAEECLRGSHQWALPARSVVELDERLAWMMSFRTVFNAPPPILWLGSIVTTKMDGGKSAPDMHEAPM